jgi:hypothetical protein
MQRNRFGLILGITACAAVLITIIVPYVLAPATGVNTYYDITVIGPPVVGLIALFAAIVFIAGLVGRWSPWTVAGTALVFGLAMVVLTVGWAIAVPPALIMGLSRVDELLFHRWVLVPFALVVLFSAVLCARPVR